MTKEEKYLSIWIACFIIIIVCCLILLSTGCTYNHNYIPGEFKCRHRALNHALIMGERYPVRIVVGNVDGDLPHAQAQFNFDGEWH